MHKLGFPLLLAFILVGFTQCSLNNRLGEAPQDKSGKSVVNRQADSLVADYGVYTFGQVDGGAYLEVAGDIYYNEKYKEDALIALEAPSMISEGVSDWQKWYIIYDKTVAGHKYYTIRSVFSGQLLSWLAEHSVESKSGGTGSAQTKRLVQSPVSRAPSDKALWRFERADGAQAYSVINKATGEAISGQALSNKDSAAVMLTAMDKTSKSQLWTLVQQPLTAYRDDEVVHFFNRNKSTMGSVAFDQGMSIPLHWGANKGKVLWITQDAWDGSALQPNHQFKCTDYFQYRNSVMIQPSITDWDPENTFNIIRTGSKQHKEKQIFDVVPNTEYAWPAAGVEIGNHVYIQCGEGSGLGPNLSQSLYDLSENENFLWTVKRLTPAGITNERDINYSAGMVKAGDGFVYVFGHHATGAGYTEDAYVARFAVSDPLSWTFWDGSSWADKPVLAKGARVADGYGTVAFSYIEGKYVLVSMTQGFNCDSTRDIYMATSDSPTGPFTKLKKVYTINEYLYGKYARYYTPAIHPEFVNGRRELLVTYCLNFSACGVSDCKDGYLDPYFYRVKGIRIPYSVIGL